MSEPYSATPPAPAAGQADGSVTGEQQWIEMADRTMFPVLRPTDHLLMVPAGTSLRSGDIAVYHRGDALIACRLLCAGRRLDGPCWLIQGDNANGPDAPLGEDEIIGRVVAVEREGYQWSLEAPVWRLLGGWMANLTLAGSKRRRRLLSSIMARLPL